MHRRDLAVVDAGVFMTNVFNDQTPLGHVVALVRHSRQVLDGYAGVRREYVETNGQRMRFISTSPRYLHDVTRYDVLTL